MAGKIDEIIAGLSENEIGDMFVAIIPRISARNIWDALDSSVAEAIADIAIDQGFAFEECTEDHDPPPAEIPMPDQFASVCAAIFASGDKMAIIDLEALADACDAHTDSRSWRDEFERQLNMHRAKQRR